MSKVDIVPSDNRNSRYRVIIHVTDGISLGAVLKPSELNQLSYKIRDLLKDNEKNRNVTKTNNSV